MCYSGIVIKGLQNGRRFGFPTANISLDQAVTPPDKGVYATDIVIDSQHYQGMLYVGTRPTLDLHQFSIEIYIFDFSTDIYDKKIQFKILEKIRGERKFDTVDQLIEQIKNDKKEVLHFFAH